MRRAVEHVSSQCSSNFADYVDILYHAEFAVRFDPVENSLRSVQSDSLSQRRKDGRNESGISPLSHTPLCVFAPLREFYLRNVTEGVLYQAPCCIKAGIAGGRRLLSFSTFSRRSTDSTQQL